MTFPDSSRPLVSLVFPAYNEVENADAMIAFFREVATTYSHYHFEMVVVDDGSDDGTAGRLASLAGPDERVRVISLSRRFGSHAAVSAGLAYVSGDAAITLSADRQEPLEAVGLLLQEWQSGGDIVWGLRSVRVQEKAGGIFSKIFSTTFHSASELHDYPVEGPSQMLVTRLVIDTLNALPETNRNVLALAAWTGFHQRRVYYEQLPRSHGQSKWTFGMKLKLVFDSFVEFSHAPMTWIATAGATLIGLGLLLMLTSLVLALVGLSGDASTTVICGCVLFVGGLNLAVASLLGEYVWRIGADARHRPVYIVRSLVDAGKAKGAPDDPRS